MSKIIDVTNKVDFGNSDDEFLPIYQCVCGNRFNNWEFDISIYDDMPYQCPKCGAKLYFTSTIRVYQVEDEKKEQK